jgi:ABC-type glycerol-3-phosphate transport system substrate-binding protein
MSLSAPVIALAAVCALLAGCGERDEPELSAEPPDAATSGADAADVRVIDEWARALRAGDVEAAAALFEIPSVAENGVTLEIETTEQAEIFNASLPCGAELIDATTEGDFTTATFRLTERPGPGRCGQGAGNTAQTSFVIEDGKILEWRRVGLPGGQPSGQAT